MAETGQGSTVYRKLKQIHFGDKMATTPFIFIAGDPNLAEKDVRIRNIAFYRLVPNSQELLRSEMSF